jgi:cellobiose-specific phosphotransferase system component IIB
MSNTQTLSPTTVSEVTASIGDSYIKWMHDAETAVANNDPVAALQVVMAGLDFASKGQNVADKTFELLEQFGAFWSESEIRMMMVCLGKSKSTTDKLVLTAGVIALPGIKRKETEHWEILKEAIGKVVSTTGASTSLIIPTVKAAVANRRADKPLATMSYRAAANVIEEIAKAATAEARKVDPQRDASASLKTMRTNSQKLLLSIQAKDVELTDEVKFLIGEIITILNSIK